MTKLSDVSLEAFSVEPAKHLIKLLAKEEADHRHGDPPKPDRLPQDPAEDSSRLGVGQLAPGELELQPQKALRRVKGQRGEGADVVGGDSLVGLVGADRIHEFALQDSYFHLVDVVILHEGSRPEDGGGQAERANVLLDLPLAIPVVDAGIPFRPADGAVDKMLYPPFLGCIRQVLALLHFPPGTDVYARRDVDKLARMAAARGEAIGIYAARILDTPLPWTRMRAVYALIGLARTYGNDPVEQACAAALELDVISVAKIKSIVEKGTGKQAAQAAARSRQAGDAAARVTAARFARDPREFATATGVRMQVLPGGGSPAAAAGTPGTDGA